MINTNYPPGEKMKNETKYTIDYEKQDKLVPVVVIDTKTKEVLMLAYANKEAVEKTLEIRKAHYFSRSRNKLWLKGESSGNFQLVQRVAIDCDNDTLLYEVKQIGPACHEGYKSCFFRDIDADKATINQKRIEDPEKIYKR